MHIYIYMFLFGDFMEYNWIYSGIYNLIWDAMGINGMYSEIESGFDGMFMVFVAFLWPYFRDKTLEIWMCLEVCIKQTMVLGNDRIPWGCICNDCNGIFLCGIVLDILPEW